MDKPSLGEKHMKHLSVSLNLRRFRPFRFRDFSETCPRDGRLTLYLLIVCFAVGIAGGALLIRANADIAQTVETWTTDYLVGRQNGFWAVLFASLCRSAIYLIAAFFIGMFIPGCAFAPLLPLLRGIGYGMVCGGLYRAELMGGILKNLLILFPSGGIATFVLLLAVREAIGFSASLVKATLRGAETSLTAGFKLYCTRFLILLGLTLIPALLDALIAQWIG